VQKFQTRVAFVEALRWSPNADFHHLNLAQNIIVQRDARAFVMTPEGQREIRTGDWLIKDSAGAFRPMSDEMFRQKYEPIKLPSPAV
jgi:hypothetical protein